MILIVESLFPFFRGETFLMTIDLPLGLLYDDKKEGEGYDITEC